MVKIGFLSNQLDNRGTGDALYNYAHYNEEILGNKSEIFTYYKGNHDNEAIDRFESRFGTIRFAEHNNWKHLDAVYHIKSGYDDGFRPTRDLPYLVHAVFDNDPHGTRYATISPWMGERFGLPYVPHIVEVADTDSNLRQKLEISDDAVVFGRYGGPDTFDISWVWGVLDSYTQTHDNVYFIFMNTDRPGIHIRNTRFLPPTVDPVLKKQFINTCDAMIHARGRGETFGLSIGEFAISGKPIITYASSHEKAHLQELGHFALTYNTPADLKKRLDQVVAGPLVSWGYGQYTPEKVMKKFQEVFLS